MDLLASSMLAMAAANAGLTQVPAAIQQQYVVQ